MHTVGSVDDPPSVPKHFDVGPIIAEGSLQKTALNVCICRFAAKPTCLAKLGDLPYPLMDFVFFDTQRSGKIKI